MALTSESDRWATSDLFASRALDSFVWLARRNSLNPARWQVLFRNASFVPTFRCVGLCFFFLEPEAVMGYTFAHPTPLKRSS